MEERGAGPGDLNKGRTTQEVEVGGGLRPGPPPLLLGSRSAASGQLDGSLVRILDGE